MDFSDALDSLQVGFKIWRTGWNGQGQYLGIQQPDKNSKNTLPYIWIRTVNGDRVPWTASQTDLLAKDWEKDREE